MLLPTPDTPFRTIVADDDAFARRTIKSVLQAASVTVIAEAATGRQAVELAVYYRPDVVLMDAVMPDIDGVEATRRLSECAPEVRVILVSASEHDDLGLLALRNGAVGVVSKSLGPETLPEAVAAVCRGEAVVSRRLAARLVENLRITRTVGTGMRPVRSVMTAREWEVLDLLSAGGTTASIADALVVSQETVRSHVKHLVRKLGVNSRREAVAAAQQLRCEPSLALSEGPVGGDRPKTQV